MLTVREGMCLRISLFLDPFTLGMLRKSGRKLLESLTASISREWCEKLLSICTGGIAVDSRSLQFREPPQNGASSRFLLGSVEPVPPKISPMRILKGPISRSLGPVFGSLDLSSCGIGRIM